MSATNLHKDYHGISWSEFADYGLCDDPEAKLPSGCKRYEASKNLAQPNYGPVVISVLEDSAPLLLNFLHTLDLFFRGIQPEQVPDAVQYFFSKPEFLPGSDVHIVWGTSPQDLEERHKNVIHDLEKQGFSKDEINHLNILDYVTNIIEAENVIPGENYSGKPGGLQAIKNLQNSLNPEALSATVIQTSIWEPNFAKRVEEETGYKTREIPPPHQWQEFLPIKLIETLQALWNEKEIPVLKLKLATKAIILEMSNNWENAKRIFNTPMIQLLEAFNSFVQDRISPERVQTNGYSKPIK